MGNQMIKNLLILSVLFFSACQSSETKKGKAYEHFSRSIVGTHLECAVSSFRSYSAVENGSMFLFFRSGTEKVQILSIHHKSKPSRTVTDLEIIGNDLWIGYSNGYLEQLVMTNSSECEVVSYNFSSSAIKSITVVDSPNISITLENDHEYQYSLEKDKNSNSLSMTRTELVHGVDKVRAAKLATKMSKCQELLRGTIGELVIKEEQYCCYMNIDSDLNLTCFSIVDGICSNTDSIIAVEFDSKPLPGISISASDKKWCQLEMIE